MSIFYDGATFGWVYAFFGLTESSIKQHLRCRRLRLDQGGEVFTAAPAFVMPYRSGRTDEVEKALSVFANSGWRSILASMKRKELTNTQWEQLQLTLYT
jgi:hypothetical protein